MSQRSSFHKAILDRMTEADSAPFKNFEPDPWPKVREVLQAASLASKRGKSQKELFLPHSNPTQSQGDRADSLSPQKNPPCCGEVLRIFTPGPDIIFGEEHTRPRIL